MIRTALAIAAAALAIPAVASAEPRPNASAAAATTVARAPRYCVVDTVIGSRLEHRTCQSLEAWLAEGFDPRTGK